jgi:hypothetical protein
VAVWLINSVGRDYATALECIDRALLIMGDDPSYDDMRATALDARTFTLQNLDEWERAALALRQSREFALRTGRPDRATWASAAVLWYWLGQWDDALAEMGSDATDVPGLVYSWLRERWSALLFHGLAALIAGRRDQRTTADQHLREGLALPIEYLTDRENRDFLVAAHALSLEQRGETRQAMLRLAGLIPRPVNEMTLTHQWLPDLVRLALTVGERDIAQAAAEACQVEAAAGTRPAAASLRCYGLLESDPERLREAVGALPGGRSGGGTARRPGGPGCRAGRARSRRGRAGRPDRSRCPVRGHGGSVGHPAGRGSAAPVRHQAGRSGPPRGPPRFRLGGAYPH